MRKLLIILTLALLSTLAVSAQNSLRLPDRYGELDDRYASIGHANLTMHLPDVATLDLRPSGQDLIAEDLLDYARTFMGTRYRRGAKGPSAFDCSGYTGYIFKNFGYPLGASSRDQWKQGEALQSDDTVLPGDLVFFSGRSAGKTVGHVGIAISQDPVTRDITFIHASTSSGVRVDKTSAPYYARRYLGARRIIGTE